MQKSLILSLLAFVLLLGVTAQALVDVTRPGDVIKGVPNDGVTTGGNDNGWPPNELPKFAIDDQILTKYLHFKGNFEPTGIRVTPSVGPTIVTGITLTTANDAVERDPVEYELYGSNESIDGPYTLIAEGSIVDFADATAWPRRTINETPIRFDNNVAYEHYQLMFPTVRDPAAANSMQIAEIELLTPVYKASDPAPADGAVHEDTWANLTWTAGETAVSHDVYISSDRAEVESGAAEAFAGNQMMNFLVVGFPGFAFPEGLQPGTTYYWRVDEINPDHPDSPWVGDVWSFTVPPKKAWRPDPPNGAKFIDTDTDLSWMPGWGAKLHTVYFGDNFDEVNDATGGVAQIGTTYTLDTLEMGKTYYWRVDEFDAATTHKGDVWSFTTTTGGGGILGEYFGNTTLSGEPVLTRIESQINFNWGDGTPDPVLSNNSWSARWTSDLNVLFPDTYTFSVNSEGGTRLWINGELVIDVWVSWVATRYASQPISLDSGIHSLRLEFADFDRAAQQQLYWSAPSVPEEIIPAGPLQPPFKARRPSPPDGGVNVRQAPTLSWVSGYQAASHQVYFGTDADAVANATTESPEYKGVKDLGDEMLDPGQLEPGAMYYWRVDEVNDLNSDSPWVGSVWSFTTANFLIVDDFETYTDNDAEGQAIWQTWVDGFGVADNGAVVGYLLPPYAERAIIHGGLQSMPLFYDNTQGVLNSEATLALGGMDLTQGGGTTLKVWYRGVAGNAPAPVYTALDNARIYHPNPSATEIEQWTVLEIDLQDFAQLGANPARVNQLALGVGDGTAASEGTGTLYIDDIGVH
ncbi:MAG: hypothetical protein JXM79_21040 [Sedimentisphaerales bacterium]|nr:hypothetical protein [Sedimentisphaerales bacterium]